MIACAANSGRLPQRYQLGEEADEVKAEAGDERPLVQHAHDQARVHRAQPRSVRGIGRAPTGRLYRHRLHDRGDAIAQGSHQCRRHADQHISDPTPPTRRQASQLSVCPRCDRIGRFRRRSEWVCDVGHEMPHTECRKPRSSWHRLLTAAWLLPSRAASCGSRPDPQPRGAAVTPCAASAVRACARRAEVHAPDAQRDRPGNVLRPVVDEDDIGRPGAEHGQDGLVTLRIGLGRAEEAAERAAGEGADHRQVRQYLGDLCGHVGQQRERVPGGRPDPRSARPCRRTGAARTRCPGGSAPLSAPWRTTGPGRRPPCASRSCRPARRGPS